MPSLWVSSGSKKLVGVVTALNLTFVQPSRIGGFVSNGASCGICFMVMYELFPMRYL